MIFATENAIEKILRGEKTQTRHTAKPQHFVNQWHLKGKDDDTINQICVGSRDVYCVGKDYAVQPGLGKHSVARIRITDIRLEDVRNIRHEDAEAEGYENVMDFLAAWVFMHDGSRGFGLKERWSDHGHGWYRIWTGRKTKWQTLTKTETINVLRERPAERYQAWALTFELVQR